jgi:uncharacterized short protein YbdD (DUF466 family)
MIATSRISAGLTRAAAVLRRVIGVPDYERYVAHMRATHPECAVMTAEEFARESMERRYSTPGSRCC